ncbi:MAG: hypothetical protein U0792_24815 [Gemmataceae bacterium]
MKKAVPGAQQVRDYLEAHGWRASHEIRPVGTMYQAAILSDDNEPLTVFAPAHEEFDDYALRVSDILDSLTVLERRSRDVIRAEMLAEKTTAAAPNGSLPAVSEAPPQPLA